MRVASGAVPKRNKLALTDYSLWLIFGTKGEYKELAALDKRLNSKLIGGRAQSNMPRNCCRDQRIGPSL